MSVTKNINAEKIQGDLSIDNITTTTISAVTYQNLPSSPLTVGTTPITSGTDGRIFFQDGGVVQQDAGLFWDNTNKRLGVGTIPDSTVRLDVRSQGVLSTDIAFRVRNSGDTANLIGVSGNGQIGLQQNAQFGFYQFLLSTDGSVTNRVSGVNSPWKFNNSSGILCADIGVENSVGKLGIVNAITAFGISDNRVLTFGVGGKGKVVIGGNITNTTQLPNEASSNIIFIRNGTAPTLNLGDAYQQYSADITAGNAAPHFRTESGDVVKLYKETAANVGAGATFTNGTGAAITEDATFGGLTLAQIAKALGNLGLVELTT